MNKINSNTNQISYDVLDQIKPIYNQKLLKEKINELQNAILRTEKEYNTAIQSNEQSNKLNKQKQTQNSLDNLSNQKDSQIQNLIIDNQKLVKTIQKLETKINITVELQNENQILKKNVQDLKKEIELLKQKQTLKNDNKLSSDASLGFLAAKRSQEIQILTNEVRESKQKNQNLEEKLDKLISENSNLQYIIKNSENQYLKTDSQANSIKKNIFVERISDKKQTPQLYQLQLELEDAKKTITQLQRLNNTNKYSQQSSNYKFSNSSDKISKSQSLEPSNFDKDRRLKQLEEQIKKLEFEKDNQIYNTKLECAQDMKWFQEKLKQEYDQKQQYFQQEEDKPTQDKIKKLTAENNRFQIMLERQNKEIMNMEKKLTEFLILQEELKKNIQKEQQYQNYLKQEKQLIQNQLKQKDQEIIDYKDDIIKLSTERQQLRDQIEKLKLEFKMNQYKGFNKPESHQSERSKRKR